MSSTRIGAQVYTLLFTHSNVSQTISAIQWSFSGDEEANRLSTAAAIAELVQGLGTPDPEEAGVLINQVTEELVPTSVAAKPHPTPPAASKPESSTDSATEHSVTSQNLDFICQEIGTVSQEVKIVGDQLELGGQIYAKTSVNGYKRSWMGYYILSEWRRK